MKKERKQEKNKQMELGLRSPIANVFFGIKSRFKKMLLYFEAVSYFKDEPNWFYIVLILTLITLQIYFIYNTFEYLPSLLPIFSYFTQPEQKLLDKVYIWIVPAVSFILLLFGIRFSHRYFHKERLMSRFLLLILLVSSVLLSIQVIRLCLEYYG